MKVTPVASPQAADAGQQGQQDSRARAIAKLNQLNSQPEAVANPNQVSVEELSAIKAPTHQAEPTEEKAVEQPAKVEEKAPSSSEYALLARREKALRAKEIQIQQQAKSLEAKVAEMEAKLKSYESGDYIPKDQFKQRAFEAIDTGELSYDEITQRQINNQAIPAELRDYIKRLESRLDKVDEEARSSKQAVVEQQTQAYQAAVKQIETDTKKLVFTDPAFETIKATNSVKDVVELIELTYKEDGTLLSVEEAAQMVEDHLLAEIDKLVKIDKVQKRFKPQATVESATKQSPTEQSQSKSQPAKTLTNSMASTRQLSAKERALLAFKGELK